MKLPTNRATLARVDSSMESCAPAVRTPLKGHLKRFRGIGEPVFSEWTSFACFS